MWRSSRTQNSFLTAPERFATPCLEAFTVLAHLPDLRCMFIEAAIDSRSAQPLAFDRFYFNGADGSVLYSRRCVVVPACPALLLLSDG